MIRRQRWWRCGARRPPCGIPRLRRLTNWMGGNPRFRRRHSVRSSVTRRSPGSHILGSSKTSPRFRARNSHHPQWKLVSSPGERGPHRLRPIRAQHRGATRQGLFEPALRHLPWRPHPDGAADAASSGHSQYPISRSRCLQLVPICPSRPLRLRPGFGRSGCRDKLPGSTLVDRPGQALLHRKHCAPELFRHPDALRHLQNCALLSRQ
jgi:hypothetical protein